MGVEIEVTKAAQGEETLLSNKENKATTVSIPVKDNSDPIVHTETETAKQEGSTEVPKSSLLPKDATDEWGAPKQTHTFYLPRVRMMEDPKVKTKLDQLHKTINNNKAQKGNLLSQLADKRKERNEIIQQLKPLTEKVREFNRVLNEKRTAMEPLRDELGKIRNETNAIREKGAGLCSSVKELDSLLKSLEYRMSHESMSLDEEKRLMKEIKQLEGTRARVVANEASRAKLDLDTEKDTLHGKVKLIGADMDEVRKEREAIRAKIKPLEDKKIPIDAAIKLLEDQLTDINERNNKAYNSIIELNSGKESLNTIFTENRKMLTQAKVLASKKDIVALETFASTEMEKFMAQWAKKPFRDDYEKRILPSLDQRFLSRDGRIRNPDEKPILAPEPIKVAEPEPSPVSTPLPKPALTKHSKEKEVIAKTEEDVKVKGGSNQEADSVKAKEKEKEKMEKVDLEKLKKLKREEEIAKNKMALERKKKQAEKKLAKAEAKALKEAEEKLKKKEKKAKKKSAPEGSEDAAETEPTAEEAVEPEEDSKDESIPVPAKTKPQKENISTVVRQRGGGKKGQSQLPRAILRKKKSQSMWSSWTSLSAMALVVVLAVLLGGFAFYYKYYHLASEKLEA